MSKTDKLMLNTFWRHGCAASGVSTDTGTSAQWRYLTDQGFVKKQAYRSPLGHKFSYDLTEDGKAHLKRLAVSHLLSI